MPEPIQSAGRNISQYDATGAPSTAAPAAKPVSPIAAAPPPHSPAVLLLVKANSLLPKPSPECLTQAADTVKGSGLLVATAGAMLASGTLAPVAAFIGASMIFAATLATYTNCEEDAAEKAKAKAP